jgi:hypothetical protein
VKEWKGGWIKGAIALIGVTVGRGQQAVVELLAPSAPSVERDPGPPQNPFNALHLERDVVGVRIEGVRVKRDVIPVYAPGRWNGGSIPLEASAPARGQRARLNGVDPP